MKKVDWVHLVPLTADFTSPIDTATLLHCHVPAVGSLFSPHIKRRRVTRSLEATHIAAGMLCAGYGGVVGTMWSMEWTASRQDRGQEEVEL